MALPGPHPMPLEVKRRHGRTDHTDSGGRPLPVSGDLVALPMAEATPAMPAQIVRGGPGADLWNRIWHEAITWISPHTDMASAVHACTLADDLDEARKEWRASMNPKDARVMIALGKQFMEALAVLGFTPTARSRLGVAEVRRVSALDKLMERRATRE